MTFPQNPVDGQFYKNFYWNEIKGLWFKNSLTAVFPQSNSEYLLPENSRIGDTIDVYVPHNASDLFVTQPDNVTITRGNSHTETGTAGRLRMHANQILKLVQIGDIREEVEQYDLIADFLTETPPSEIKSLAVSPNGFYVAVSYITSPYVSIYRYLAGRYQKQDNYFTGDNSIGHQVLAMTFSDDSSKLAIAIVAQPYLVLFDFAQGYPQKMPDVPGAGSGSADAHVSYALDWNGNYLAEGHPRGPHHLTIYDFANDQAVEIADVNESTTDVVHAVEFSPDGLTLAAGHVGAPVLTIYKKENDVFVKQNYRRFPRTGEIVKHLSWSFDSQYLAFINEGNIQVYDMSGSSPIKKDILINRPAGFVYTAIRCAPAANIVAIASYHEVNNNQGTIEFFNMGAAGVTKLDQPAIEGLPSIIHDIRWTTDEQHFIVAHGGAPFLSVYTAAKLHKNAWQLVHVDGPEIQSTDFVTI